MMWLHDLFKRDNVEIPDWLSNDYLKEEWETSTYLKGENIHKWELNTPFGFKSIALEKETYTFTAYDEDNNLIFERIETPEETIIS